jgi:tetratricopeptide (TPR) repeat protein
MTRKIIGAAATAVLAAAAAAPAFGQYAVPPAQQQQRVPQPVPSTSQDEAPAPTGGVSKGAFKAIKELQTAVDAYDTAAIPAKLAAAQAVAKTKQDRYLVARLQLKAAGEAKDSTGIRAGIEAVLASGAADQSVVAPLYLNLAKIEYEDKQYDQAAASFERVLALEPNNTDAMVLLGETRQSQGRSPDAVSLIQKAIQVRLAAGQKPDEAWYKRALALAYNNKLPSATELSRQWVAAYPTADNWRDALRVYRSTAQPDEAGMLDALRLARATGSLSGDVEYHNYAVAALQASSPLEAKAVLDEGKIDQTKPMFAQLVTSIKAARSADAAALAAAAKDVESAPAGRPVLRVAEGYYGLGDYTHAAQMYRLALTKSGVDANQVNLRLGMALARAGDKAGAVAALNAVGGAQAELAKYWLVYVNSRA